MPPKKSNASTNSSKYTKNTTTTSKSRQSLTKSSNTDLHLDESDENLFSDDEESVSDQGEVCKVRSNKCQKDTKLQKSQPTPSKVPKSATKSAKSAIKSTSKRKAAIATSDLESETISLLDDDDHDEDNTKRAKSSSKRSNRTKSLDHNNNIIPDDVDIVDISLTQSQHDDDNDVEKKNPLQDFNFLLQNTSSMTSPPRLSTGKRDNKANIIGKVDTDLDNQIQQGQVRDIVKSQTTTTATPSSTPRPKKSQLSSPSSDQPPVGVLPTRPLKSQSCLYRFADATSVDDLQSIYIAYNNTDKIPNPLMKQFDDNGFDDEKDKGGSNNGKKKNNTQLQKGKFKNEPNYDMFMSLHELCTMFLVLSGQLSLDVDDVFTFLDEVYQGGADWVTNTTSKTTTTTNTNTTTETNTNTTTETNTTTKTDTTPIETNATNEMNDISDIDQNVSDIDNDEDDEIITPKKKIKTKKVTGQSKKTPKQQKNENQQISSPSPSPGIPPNLNLLTNPSQSLHLGSFDLKGGVKHRGLSLYHQLIVIPPPKLYIDSSILSQLGMGLSTRYQFDPVLNNNSGDTGSGNDTGGEVKNRQGLSIPLLPHTPTALAPATSTHQAMNNILKYSNLIKQADKYGDYDGLCSFVDFLNVARVAGLWIDLNYDLYL